MARCCRSHYKLRNEMIRDLRQRVKIDMSMVGFLVSVGDNGNLYDESTTAVNPRAYHRLG